MLKTTRFDAADFLDTEKKQAAYITAALETGDADFVRDALGIVAKARGMGRAPLSARVCFAVPRRSAEWIST
jgi:probable addiction module antidote protein